MNLKSFTVAIFLLPLYAAAACASPVGQSAAATQSFAAASSPAPTSDPIQVIIATGNLAGQPEAASGLSEEESDVRLSLVASGELGTPVVAGFSGAPAPFGERPADLPALPGGLALSLFGFLCLSAYRDRAFWHDAAVRAFLLAHAGFCALPRLAASLASTALPGLAPSRRLVLAAGRLRPRAVWPETAFAGLLHRLASRGADAAPSAFLAFWQVSLIAVATPLSGAAAFSFCPAALVPRRSATVGSSGARGALRLRLGQLEIE